MSLENSILKILAYFDMFDYPVSLDEIQFFLASKKDKTELFCILQELQRSRQVFRHAEFYSLRNDLSLTERRVKGNNRARPLLVTGHRIARFLFRFPYVRGIGISGSLSKNMADETSDIDFFIITSTNRLWIARTLMHLFKKLTYLTGRQHWYCMNYYIDEAALQIEEKNVFTAMETITLIPVCGNGAIDNFFNANSWVNTFYPGYAAKVAGTKTKAKHYFLKRIVETVFNNKLGDWIDDTLLRITSKRWAKKEAQKKLNIKGGRMGLKTGKHFSKPNPAFFQEKIIAMYNYKVANVETRLHEMSMMHSDN
jgi:hypothetical protein